MPQPEPAGSVLVTGAGGPAGIAVMRVPRTAPLDTAFEPDSWE